MSEQTCPICFNVPIKSHTLPCKHTFCTGCIQLSLQLKSNCPMCRRVCCVMLNRQPQKINEIFQPNPPFKLMPYFNSLSTIPFGKEVLFQLEAEDEIEVINKALERDLLVAVLRGNHTDIWQINDIRSQPNDPVPYYECLFKNIGRANVVNMFDDLILLEEKHDTLFDPQCEAEFTQIYEVLQKMIRKSSDEDKSILLDAFGVLSPQSNKTSIEEASLRILCHLRMDQRNFNSLYYGTDTYRRLQVIKKHLYVLEEYL